MSQDTFPISRVDHIEFYVGNARQAAHYYASAMGFTQTGYSGLETGNRTTTSYVMEQGNIRFVFTSALTPDHPIARHAFIHGDGVGVIALGVPDAEYAYQHATRHGATGAIPFSEKENKRGVYRTSAVKCYGDTIVKFVDRESYKGVFAPGFRPTWQEATGQQLNGSSQAPRFKGIGLASVDHIVGNVELGAMNRWVDFFANTMGFSQLLHFDDEDISTEYSALMSKVMTNGNGKIKFPINEPAEGKKKSQIQEYLDYYMGPGVQHVALSTGNILQTVQTLQDRGIKFLTVPTTYYDELEARVGKIDEPTEELARLGILVDRDDDGYLLQIFTKPVQDRPTVFYEVIERHGARGFGEGNFKALFESIEREQALRGNL